MAGGSRPLSDLTLVMNDWGQDVYLGANEVKKIAARAIHREVIQFTPVDTGLARSNWQASAGTPILNEIPPYAPGSHLGRQETANMAGAMQQGLRAIAPVKPGVPIFIANSVFYLESLDKGTSSQAPAGFVAAAVLAGVFATANFRFGDA